MAYKKVQIEGKPEWAEIGVMVMVRNHEEEEWTGPMVLYGYGGFGDMKFETERTFWLYAKPVESWEPKEGEFCAFWNDDMNCFVVGRYCGKNNFDIDWYMCDNGANYENIARLGPDVDAACDVETLKTRTDWL